jgi:cell division protein FtsW
MIFSASSVISLDAHGSINTFLYKQLTNVALGLFVLIVAAKVKYQFWRKHVLWMNLVAIGCQCLLFVPGFAVTVNGAPRWVSIAGFQFQPSEICKIVIVFTLAHMIEKRKEKGLNNFAHGIVPIGAYLLLYCVLILLKTHLSAIMIIAGVSLFMMIVGGLAKRYILFMLALGAGGGVLGVIIEPYRMQRIFGFLNPEADPMGKGFQIVQSWYALGSGEIFGLGLGMSRQKFSWLPENHTDFIVGVIGEEIGFMGIMMVIIGFAIFILQGFSIAMSAKDHFGMLLTTGVISLFMLQFMINLAVVSGLFPVTGMPLPFISYGGTSTIILFGAVGLVFSVASQRKLEAENKK